MTGNIYQQLSEPFPPEMEKTLVKSGIPLTYIPISEVINRLNRVLGVDKWDFYVASCERDLHDPDFITARVRLCWNVDGRDDAVYKEAIGGQKVKRNKKGEIVDLGDDFKGAVSDALKKAAQMLGVGLYLARSEEAMDVEDAMTSNGPAMQDEQPMDKDLSDKWDKFTSIVKKFNDEQKSELNDFWSEFAQGAPKPTKSTATHQSLDALIIEATRISFGGEYATPNA